jgi:hypothetical protein
MFDGLTANALAQIDVVEQMISIHENALNDQEPSSRRLIKTYSTASCVLNLYAIYERYVENVIADYLDAIPELVPYEKLASELKTNYRIGISHILSRIESERYNHLVHENIIRWYHEALCNSENYRFVAEALTRHEQNLRLSSLESLLSKISLNDLASWLSKSERVKELYSGESSVKEQLEAELRLFIQIRNDAAHGGLEDIEGRENLHRYCSLIRCLIATISEYMHKAMVEMRAAAGKCYQIGKVTEVFKQAGAFIVQLDSASFVKVGMNVHFLGDSYCYSKTLDSLQVDSLEIERFEAPEDRFEVGMKCSITPKMNAAVFVDV